MVLAAVFVAAVSAVAASSGSLAPFFVTSDHPIGLRPVRPPTPLPQPRPAVAGGLRWLSVNRNESSSPRSSKGEGDGEEGGEDDAVATATATASDGDRISLRLGRKERKEQERRRDYERRRDLWAARYGSVDALRSTFGSNRNKLWGDLDPESTRRLYHTLLPRSLLGLHEAGLMRPDELAPLAYEARVAAKEYARERSALPGRLFAMGFDGYRSLRDYGKFRTKGMSWEQIWDKYEAQIVEEECVNELEELRRRGGGEANAADCRTRLGEDALTTRIYLRILERSCATNRAFDKMFLQKNGENRDERDLAAIATKLDSDVREILLNPKEAAKALKKAEKAEKEAEKAKEKAEKAERKERKKAEKAEKKREKDKVKAERKDAKRSQWPREEREEEGAVALGMVNVTEDAIAVLPESQRGDEDSDRKRRAWSVLRILAGTRQKFRRLKE